MSSRRSKPPAKFNAAATQYRGAALKAYYAGHLAGYTEGRVHADSEARYGAIARVAAGFDGVHVRLDRIERDLAKAVTLVDYVRRDPVVNKPLFLTRLRAAISPWLPW